MNDKPVLRKCCVWDMKPGEVCRLNGNTYVRGRNIKKRMPMIGRVENAVLNDLATGHRKLFLRGVTVDVIYSPA